MEYFTSWRELLGKLISNQQERQRIANELQMNPLTLMRWVNNGATPRPQSLHRLLSILPDHHSELLPLLRKEFGNIFDEIIPVDDSPQEIPSAFYARVFHAYEQLPLSMRSWSIFDLILQQALKQLDPNRVGMEITVVRCMYNMEKRQVRSLREALGRGTPPWNRELEERTLLLGAESLAGSIVTTGRSVTIQNSQDEQNPYPARWVEGEYSAAGHPIMRGGNMAGCLLISCTQVNYFTPARQTLIQNYADLIALAFESWEFYKREDIQLYIMPSFEVQKKVLRTFRQRVSDVLIQASRDKVSIDIKQAEQLVWQQIEEELLAPEAFRDDKGVIDTP